MLQLIPCLYALYAAFPCCAHRKQWKSLLALAEHLKAAGGQTLPVCLTTLLPYHRMCLAKGHAWKFQLEWVAA